MSKVTDLSLVPEDLKGPLFTGAIYYRVGQGWVVYTAHEPSYRIESCPKFTAVGIEDGEDIQGVDADVGAALRDLDQKLGQEAARYKDMQDALRGHLGTQDKEKSDE